MPFRDEDLNPIPPRIEKPTLEDVWGALHEAKTTDTPWWTLPDFLQRFPPPSLTRLANEVTNRGVESNNGLAFAAGLVAGIFTVTNETIRTTQEALVKERTARIQAHLDRLVDEGKVERKAVERFGNVLAYKAK